MVTAADTCSISECEKAGEQGTATQRGSQPIPTPVELQLSCHSMASLYMCSQLCLKLSEKGEVGYCCLSPSHPAPLWALSPIAPCHDTAGALTCTHMSGGDAEMGTLHTALTVRHLQAP